MLEFKQLFTIFKVRCSIVLGYKEGATEKMSQIEQQELDTNAGKHQSCHRCLINTSDEKMNNI
jgi:hypothetical protein